MFPLSLLSFFLSNTHLDAAKQAATHSHTHICIYTYKYICAYYAVFLSHSNEPDEFTSLGIIL